jgi:Tol biopolymer transport system component/plastocyanin
MPFLPARSSGLVLAGAVLALAASTSMVATSAWASAGAGPLLASAGQPVLRAGGLDQAVTTVTIRDFAFDPDEVTIQPGDIVRWVNAGQVVHTVTSDQGLFHGVLLPGETFALRFLSTGTYSYHCLYHPQMTGRVVVVPQAPAATPSPGPTVVPGAETILFDYFADSTSATRTDLFLVEPDGTDRRDITNTPLVSEVQPSWSPDRQHVAFSATAGNPSSGPWTISVLDLPSGQSRQITSGREDYEPDWRPDGSWIAYTSIARSGTLVVSSELAMVRPDGTGGHAILRLNSSYYTVANPSWSPDGNHLAFVLESGSAGGELYTFNVVTQTASKMLDHPGYNDIDPAWSPDGRYVAFASGALHQPYHDIWLLDTATGVAGAVVHVPDWDLRGPAWSPDGSNLIFSAQFQTAPAAWGLYVMPAFGGAAAQPLTSGVEPDWGVPVLALPTPEPSTTTLPTPPTLPVPSTPTLPTVMPGPTETPLPPPTFPVPSMTPEMTATSVQTETPSATETPPAPTLTPTATLSPFLPLFVPIAYRESPSAAR